MPTRPAEGHRQLEHVTDALIEAWGPTFERALGQAGLGLVETIIDTATVSPTISRILKVSGHDELELVYNWLEELLLAFEIKKMVFSKFTVERITKSDSARQLEAKGQGESYDPKKHTARVEVKGVTYHEMSVTHSSNRVTIRYLLDL